jgi:hypothetical protein
MLFPPISRCRRRRQENDEAFGDRRIQSRRGVWKRVQVDGRDCEGHVGGFQSERVGVEWGRSLRKRPSHRMRHSLLLVETSMVNRYVEYLKAIELMA